LGYIAKNNEYTKLNSKYRRYFHDAGIDRLVAKLLRIGMVVAKLLRIGRVVAPEYWVVHEWSCRVEAKDRNRYWVVAGGCQIVGG